MKISTKEEARLKKIAAQNKVKGGYAAVLALWNEEREKLKEKGITENLDMFAVNAVLNHYRRIKQKQKPRPGRIKPSTLLGIIVGDMGLRDKAEEMRRNAKRYVNKNGVQAGQDAQLINGDNQVLDQRQKIYGKENPNYLEPLDQKLKLRSRVIFALFRKNGGKVFKFTSMQTSDNKLARAWNQIHFYTPCQTFGIIKEELEDEMRVNSSQAEETVSIFRAIKEDWDITKIVEDALKNQYTKIQNVEKHFKSVGKAWDRRIFLKGVVAWINVDRPTPWGSVYMGLMDSEDEEALVRIEIPEHLAINFGELSEVIVMGRTKRTKYKDQETQKLVEGDVIVTSFGLYPIPGRTTPKESGEAETLEEEEEIEGWI